MSKKIAGSSLPLIIALVLMMSPLSPGVCAGIGETTGHRSEWHEAVIHVADEAGIPVPGANVLLVRPDGDRLFSGRTDEEGCVRLIDSLGCRVGVSLAGTRAELEISEAGDGRRMTLPLDLANLPAGPDIIVSVRPGDADSDHVRVTVLSDVPLVASPEVTLFPVDPYGPDPDPAHIPMTSPDDRA